MVMTRDQQILWEVRACWVLQRFVGLHADCDVDMLSPQQRIALDEARTLLAQSGCPEVDEFDAGLAPVVVEVTR